MLTLYFYLNGDEWPTHAEWYIPDNVGHECYWYWDNDFAECYWVDRDFGDEC